MSKCGNKIDAKIIAYEFLQLNSLGKSETKLNITPEGECEQTYTTYAYIHMCGLHRSSMVPTIE